MSFYFRSSGSSGMLHTQCALLRCYIYKLPAIDSGQKASKINLDVQNNVITL